jgi:diaminopimelate decarboxylase
MDRFEYRGGSLYCEEVAAAELAQRFGTPLYVYSADTLRQHYQRTQAAFAALDPLICFSVKSLPNLHVLRFLRSLGSGFDVVSGGELQRALRAGADPAGVVFAGVGKTDDEIRAGLAAGIGLFNCESESEMERLIALSREAGLAPRVALRVNPDVDAKTHAYTTTGRKENKFGVDQDRAVEFFRRYGRDPAVRLCAIHLHIGSPVNDAASYEQAMQRGLALIDELRGAGFAIDTIDIGGGFGAHYRGGEAPAAADYARVIVPLLQSRGLKVILEPGRSIGANAGVLLSRVVHVKDSGVKRFLIGDASMNDLIRPALYGAYHFIWPVEASARVPADRGPEQPFDGLAACDVVGPVCESGDFLAKDRRLPTDIRRGDLLAIFTAGAYAMSMANQYNSRPRGAEVLVEGGQARLIRRRETIDDLIGPEM